MKFVASSLLTILILVVLTYSGFAENDAYFTFMSNDKVNFTNSSPAFLGEIGEDNTLNFVLFAKGEAFTFPGFGTFALGRYYNFKCDEIDPTNPGSGLHMVPNTYFNPSKADQSAPSVTTIYINSILSYGAQPTYFVNDSTGRSTVKALALTQDGEVIWEKDVISSTEEQYDNLQITAFKASKVDCIFIVVVLHAQTEDDKKIFSKYFKSGDFQEIDTNGIQTQTKASLGERNPAIASADDLGFVVTWLSLEQDGFYHVLAQEFDVDGTPLADAFAPFDQLKLNTPSQPSIAMNSKGEYNVTIGISGDGSIAIRDNCDIKVGDKQNNWINRDCSISCENQNPVLDIDEEGNFVIAWEGKEIARKEEDAPTKIFMQKFDSEANPLGETEIVNQKWTNFNDSDPGITMLDINNMLITWTQENNEGISEVVGRFFYTAEAEEKIQLDLSVVPDKESFKEDDSLSIELGVKAPSQDTNIDFYFAMRNETTGELFFAPFWNKKFTPLLKNFTVPAGLDVQGIQLLEITLPSEKPPIKDEGTYSFMVVGTKPGTFQFRTNMVVFDSDYIPAGGSID